jgi:hexosaminidase
MRNYILVTCCLLSLLSCNSQTQPFESYDLLPWPKQIEENSAKFLVNSDVTISITGEDQGRVRNAAVNFLRRLSHRTGVFLNEGFPVTNNSGTIELAFEKVAELSIHVDESYRIKVDNSKINISAKTDIGALRGLATLLQLVDHNGSDYYIPGVSISDEPRFVWRGLMIDVARHYQPIDVLKRNLDAMASVKLNVFHWHLTDDQGFRVESKVYPKLHELASDGLYYTHDQIKDVVNYASDLGIRVIPEFDVPGHASAILTAYPELGSKDNYKYSIERFAGVFDPTLDPTKDITYEFLNNLFTEIAPLFPDDYFHIGGDENEGKHWDENKSIQAFKNEHKLKTNHDLQTYFNIKLEKILNKLDKKLMGWDEIMTPGMPTTAVIHSWRGENEGLPKGGSLISAAKQGYQTVLSNGYYIDRMLSVEHHYSVDPIGDVILTKEERDRILGGEATMWGELVTPITIDSRIWPRTAAIAERFWSAQDVTNIESMKRRLKDVSHELEELGITHIKNRDVILRGMSNNQDISALIDLSKICEPLKVYSRNKGGTEYKSFSPFTLFADACVVDAEDALIFNLISMRFLKDPNKENTSDVLSYLEKWSNNYAAFNSIDGNPKINPLAKLSETISRFSTLLSSCISNQKISESESKLLKAHLKILSEPFEDVEVAIIDSLNKLVAFCNSSYSSKG